MAKVPQQAKETLRGHIIESRDSLKTMYYLCPSSCGTRVTLEVTLKKKKWKKNHFKLQELAKITEEHKEEVTVWINDVVNLLFQVTLKGLC